MRALTTSLALLAAGCAAAPDRPMRVPSPAAREEAPDPGPRDRQLDFLLGVRSFEDARFEGMDEPLLFGLAYREPIGIPGVRLEGAFHYTYDEGDADSGGQEVRLKGATWDFCLGLEASVELGRVRPYVGAGGSFLFVELRGFDEDAGVEFDDDDSTFGAYVKAGVLFAVSEKAHVGLEYRRFEGGDASLDGTEVGAEHDQLAFVLGTRFR